MHARTYIIAHFTEYPFGASEGVHTHTYTDRHTQPQSETRAVGIFARYEKGAKQKSKKASLSYRTMYEMNFYSCSIRNNKKNVKMLAKFKKIDFFGVVKL